MFLASAVYIMPVHNLLYILNKILQDARKRINRVLYILFYFVYDCPYHDPASPLPLPGPLYVC